MLLSAGCSAGTPAAETPSSLASPDPTTGALPVETFDDLSTEHRRGPIEYEQVPPVGGPHNARWLACDVYDEPVPSEAAVHSMEHGGVWITHAPDLPADDVAQLAELAALDEEYVLVSPFEGLPSPVVASTWGIRLQVEDAGDPRLAEFVRSYAGGDQGGEPGAPCRSGGLTPEQLREVIDAG